MTIDYLRTGGDDFYSGEPGRYVRLGTMPVGLRPRVDLRQHAVSKDGSVVYMYVGADGSVGFTNVGTAGAGIGWFFGCAITYCVAG